MTSTLACSGDEGLIVEVTSDSITPTAIDSLKFVVATRQTDGVNSVWVKDPVSSITVDFEAEDLIDSPYRLLLHAGTEVAPDGEVIVAVFAYAGGVEVAFGKFSQPQRFVPDKVLVRKIVLEGYLDDTRPYVRDDVLNCLGWLSSPGGTVVQIASENDKDCDGDPAATDCADLDPTVGTNQPEFCDGIASSCGANPPEAVPCYGVFANTCTIGSYPCLDDTVSGGSLGVCQDDPANGVTGVPDRFCPAYDQCVMDGVLDPFGCAIVTASASVPCTLYYDNATGVLCPAEPAYFSPLPVPAMINCFWGIIDGQLQAHYKVGLSSLTDPTPLAEVNACDVRLQVVRQLDNIPQLDTVWTVFSSGGFLQPLRLDFTPVGVVDCPPPAFAVACGN